MSKKSVVIALPPRVMQARTGEAREADGWVNATTSPGQAPQSTDLPEDFGKIDLTTVRNPLELAWMIWTFPALATLHWMAVVMGQQRSR